MKKNLLLFTLLLTFSTTAYSLAPNTQAVNAFIRFDAEGNLMVFSDNKDHCDYYLSVTLADVRGFDVNQVNPYTTTVRQGERKLFTLRRFGDMSPSYRWSYMAYKGKINAKLNLDFIYALPVKPGDSLQATPLMSSSNFTLEFDLSYSGDTIYACREGRICDEKLTDQSGKGGEGGNRIIVYHTDGSFSDYSYFEKSLVYPGEYVKIGQPIAVNTGKTQPKKIFFAVYYLDKDKMQNFETRNKYSHIVPAFQTYNAGVVKLEEETMYTGEINELLITQEMSAREKKKYEKNKQKQAQK